MLRQIAAVLLVLWLLGLVGGFGFHLVALTAGGLIHILLVIAIVMFVIDLLTGTRTV